MLGQQHTIRLSALACVLTFGLTACSGGGSGTDSASGTSSSPAAPSSPVSIDNGSSNTPSVSMVLQKAKFNTEINQPVMQNTCVICHKPGGVASKTRLVLQMGADEATAEHNAGVLEAFTDTQLFLDKISNRTAHVGSPVITLGAGTVEYRALEAFLNKEDYFTAVPVVDNNSPVDPTDNTPSTPDDKPPATIDMSVLSASNVNATAKADHVLLEWLDKASNESYYKVQRKMQGGMWQVIAELATNATSHQDHMVSHGVTYEYRVLAGNATHVGISSISSAQYFVAVVPMPEEDTSEPTLQASVVWAINAGGAAFTDDEGTEYLADKHYNGGNTYRTGNGIADTMNDTLYQSERWGSFSYSLKVDNGRYDVIVNLAEIYHNASDRRVFDVKVEGSTRLSNVDIHKQVGSKTALDLTISNIEVTDGVFNLEVVTVKDQAKLNAFKVIGYVASENTMPSMPEPKDSDNDGIEDGQDAFPFDASESKDSDGDGVGDNADAYPNDASRFMEQAPQVDDDNDSNTPVQPEPSQPTDGLSAELKDLLKSNVVHQIWNNTSSLDTLKEYIETNKTPDQQKTYESADSDSNIADKYVSRMLVQVKPEFDSAVNFYVASDDHSELYFIAANQQPQLVANVDGYTDPKEWDRHASQKSATFNLKAGNTYLIEALHAEGGGGDHVSIGWSHNGGDIQIIEAPEVQVLDISLNENVIQAKCIACHRDGGPAKNSGLIFQSGNSDEAKDYNEVLLANYILNNSEGAQTILDKVQGKLKHGGGAVLTPGSEQFNLLGMFIDFFDGEGSSFNPESSDEAGELHGVNYAALSKTCGVSEAAPPVMRRLTRDELIATVRSAFPQLGDDWETSILTADARTEMGFDNDVNMVTTSVGFLDQWTRTVENVADQLLYGDGYDQIAPCGDELNCLKQQLPIYAKQLSRGVISSSELDELYSFWSGIKAETNSKTAWRWTLAAAMQHPSVIYRSELGVFNGAEYVLTGRELADQLAYTYTGNPPDAALLALADAGELSDPNVRMNEATRLLETSAGKKTLVRFVRIWLKLDAGQGNGKDALADFGPLSKLMTEEAERLAEMVLFNDNGTAADLLTANYTVLNTALAEHYGFDNPGNDWEKVNQDTTRSMGILGTGAILAGHAQGGKSSPTQRGLLVYERLLCQDVPPPPDEIPAVDVPVGTKLTTRQIWEQTHAGDVKCQVCHQNFDPLGYAFENFDELGKFRSHEWGIPVDASGSVPGGNSINGLPNLAQEIAQDSRLADCTTGFMNKWAFGGAGGKSCLAENARREYTQGNMSLVEYFIALAGEPNFHRRKAQ